MRTHHFQGFMKSTKELDIDWWMVPWLPWLFLQFQSSLIIMFCATQKRSHFCAEISCTKNGRSKQIYSEISRPFDTISRYRIFESSVTKVTPIFQTVFFLFSICSYGLWYHDTCGNTSTVISNVMGPPDWTKIFVTQLSLTCRFEASNWSSETDKTTLTKCKPFQKTR